MMSEGQQVAVEIGAAAVGVVQPFLLRQYIDTKYGTLIPQIGAYGTPSAIAGIVAGGAALVAGLMGILYGKGPVSHDPQIAKALISYGAPALTTSMVIAYLTPTVSAAAATKAQGVFSPQKVSTGPARAMSAAERNFRSLTPQQQVQMGVY